MESGADHSLKQLCELAANEQDPSKMLTLIREIIRVLGEKEQQLKAASRQDRKDEQKPL
jgi:hypothetical protein